MDNFLNFLASNPLLLNVTISIVVLVILSYVIMSFIGLAQGKEINFFSLKIGQDTKNETPSNKSQKLKASEYGIKFGKSIYDEHDNSFDVDGTLEKRPPSGYQLWVFIVEDKGREVHYWAQESASIRDDNSWHSKVNYVGSGKHRLSVYLVGADGQALIDLYMLAGKKINDLNSESAWVPIIKRTNDMIECIDVMVKVK